MIPIYNHRLVGVWRSLVAHLHGVQGVEGSNPFTPTIFFDMSTGYSSDAVTRFHFRAPMGRGHFHAAWALPVV